MDARASKANDNVRIAALQPGRAEVAARTRCLAYGVLVASGVAVWSTRALSAEPEDVSVTPYRPTVSTPAALSAPGWLEIEAGLQGADVGGAPRRDSFPYALKLALTEDWGVRVAGEAWVRDPTALNRESAPGGDTSLILKRRFAVNDRSAFGLELGLTAPTARAGLHSGSGQTDYTATGIYSSDFAHSLHADFNLGLTRLGSADPSTSHHQAMWAAALQDGVSARWGIVAELSGTRQGGTRSTAQLLGGATFSPGKRVTWDFGVARGLNSPSPGWTLFVGTTFLAARVF